MQPLEQLTVGQAARTLGLSPERLRQLVRQGRIPAIATPYGRLFNRTDLDHFLTARRSQEHRP
jgi:excisionase family DNA binding protein